MNPYIVIIAVSLIVILSYFFSQFSKRTNVPSVLLLIMLGVGLKYVAAYFHLNLEDKLGAPLELLGIVGLTMIVLEAALDLKLEKEKTKMIVISFVSSIVGLFITSLGIAWLVQSVFDTDFFTAMVYSVPFGIMSSAIIIPSIGKLVDEKKEFLIYESTFSDIIGIMLFYFLIGNKDVEQASTIASNVVLNIVLTVLLSLVVGYVMVMLLQRLTGEIKLFLLIATLILLYATGKMLHLSSLLMILTFGLLLNNYKLFFRGKMAGWVDGEKLEHVEEDFHIITLESAFVVRTFFFVVFGMTIDFAMLAHWQTALLGFGILGIIYGMRLLGMGILSRKQLLPGLFIAPRGLITILLSFGIPASIHIEGFDAGIMLYVILGSSLVMTFALMSHKEDSVKKLAFGDMAALDERIKKLKAQQENSVLKE